MRAQVMVYWLMPAEPHREFFRRLIHDLAVRFDAPEFEPHVTVFVAPEEARPPHELLANIQSRDVALVTGGLGWSAKFTKTLFVKFKTNPELLDLVEMIRKLSGADSLAGIDPHLSLLYKALPGETQRNLAAKVRIPFDAVRFNSICVVRCTSPTKAKADVLRWKVIATQNSTTRKME